MDGFKGWMLLQTAAFLLVAGYAIFLFAHVVWSRIRFISLGRKEEMADWGERVRQALGQIFGHRTLLKDRRSGIMHMFLFYGFILVQFGAIDLIGQGLAPDWQLPLGGLYPAFKLLQEITVMLILLAVLYAYYRRYVEKLARLKRTWRAGIVLLLIALLMASVLLAQGFHLLWKGEMNAAVQPVGTAIGRLLEWLAVTPPAAEAGFYVMWWLHLLILLGFLVYVPQSKHAHLLFAPFNLLFRRREPPGKLSMVDVENEEAETFGVETIEQFTRNQLTDLYACVECGRCTSVCPASTTGKLLSPMDLIVHMRDHLTAKGAAITARTPWMPAFVFASTRENRAAVAARRNGSADGGGKDGSGSGESGGWRMVDSRADSDGGGEKLIGDVVSEQELWACTTCRNCEDQCPVGNEHVSMIVDMRRFLVMTEGSMPPGAARALNNLERQGNPWGISRKERIKWLDDLEPGLSAPLCKEGRPFDYLLFVGSMGSYDKRSMKITHALIKIMNRAEISFAILGGEEGNSGDTARRLGNDYLYQQLASENIAAFRKYKVKRIITIDPHAFNTIKHEYPMLGLPEDVKVFHHTELIAQWLYEGRLHPRKPVKERITYHDSCYLGRYNQVYSGPRDIIRAIPGTELVEMERSGSNSMCCGAGGGLMWIEESEGKRINTARTEQALAVQPTVIGTACPYCLTMLSDGTKQLEAEERVRTMDVAELLALSLE